MVFNALGPREHHPASPGLIKFNLFFTESDRKSYTCTTNNCCIFFPWKIIKETIKTWELKFFLWNVYPRLVKL